VASQQIRFESGDQTGFGAGSHESWLFADLSGNIVLHPDVVASGNQIFIKSGGIIKGDAYTGTANNDFACFHSDGSLYRSTSTCH
jgi:hypothetical protein